jgi:hypothetical protein
VATPAELRAAEQLLPGSPVVPLIPWLPPMPPECPLQNLAFAYFLSPLVALRDEVKGLGKVLQMILFRAHSFLGHE